MTTFWAEQAWLPDGLTRGVQLSVADGRFMTVNRRNSPAPDDVPLRGMVLPGMANAHSHVFQRTIRGRGHALPDAHAWHRLAYAVADRLNPDLYLALARAVFTEMLLAGYTVVGEYHYLHHGPGGTRYADPNAMGRALVQAAEDVGIRLTLLDVCRLRGGLTAGGYLPVEGAQERFSDGSVAEWAARMTDLKQGELLRRGAAIHSLRTVSREEAAEVVAVTGDRPLHVYVSEQPSENLACQMYYGATPAAVLEGIGALGPETSAIHASLLDDADVDRIVSASSQVIVCPTSERDMGLDLGPVRRLTEHGVPVSIGSDSQAVIDPFAEMREVEMHERVVAGERMRLTQQQLISIGSRHGYASLGWYGGGLLAPGYLADLVVVDPDSVRTVGTKAGQILSTATAADVVTVVVGGKVVVKDGWHAVGPVEPLLREAMSMVRAATVG